MKLEASYHQERLWFIDKFETGSIYKSSPCYHNIPIIIEMSGKLDLEILEKSIRKLIERHDILRTSFFELDSKPFQKINEAAEFCLERLTFNQDERDLLPFIEDISKQPMPILNNKLLRGLVIECKNKSVLLLTVHHSIFDKPSIYLSIAEIFKAYALVLDKGSETLDPPQIQYGVFAKWQKNLPSKTIKALFAYWKRKLNGKLQPLEFALDRPRKLIHTYNSGVEHFQIEEEVGKKILQLGKETEMDFQVYLLAAFKLLMKNYSNNDEVVIGTSSPNRIQEELRNTIGPLSNLLVLRSFLESGITFHDLVGKVNQTLQEAIKYQSIPFDRLVKELAPEIDMGRTALFDVLFQYEDETRNSLEVGDLQVKYIERNLGWGKYDLNLLLQRENSIFSGTLVYNTDYFNRDTILQLITHFQELLKNAVLSPERKIETVPFVSENEKKKILLDFNKPKIAFPQTERIIDLFEKQVSIHPDKVAVKYKDQEITYHCLNVRANQLANLLYRKKVGPETIVALALDHNIDMITTIFGVLKTGAAYMPIDKEYPIARIEYMLHDSDSKIIVTSKDWGYDLSNASVPVIYLDQDIDSEALSAPENTATPNSLAYVIYTSGTTGMPKGALIENKNVVRLLFNQEELFDFNHKDRWSLFHSFCFDFSVWEMYGALLFGGELLIIPKLIAKDPSEFLELICQHQISILNQTPSAFYNLIEVALKKDVTLQIRNVIFGGEALSPTRLKEWNSLYPKVRLINMYGITETTVHVTYKEITKKEIDLGVSNIGKPIPTTIAYILNEDQQLVPVGVPGELYIGGKGVGRGYIGKPELNKEKFIDDPFNIGERLYRSGDLGRWNSKGEIEYLGRIDHQVQLRGFRIELGEVESVLQQHTDVKEAIVLFHAKDNSEYICAYYVGQTDLEIAELRRFLAKSLPDYMLPLYFVRVERIPLTINGKVDKAALPLPTIVLNKDKEIPRNRIEQMLVNIYEEVLGVKNISIDDNFFHLGGDSIKTIQVSSRLLKEGYELKIQDIFKNPIIRDHSHSVVSKDIKEDNECAEGQIPLTPIQSWFFDLDSNDTHHFNQSILLKFDEIIDDILVRTIFRKIVEHHDMLRATFLSKDGVMTQQVNNHLPDIELEILELKDFSTSRSIINSKANEAHKSMDLEGGLLLKLVLFKDFENQKSQLLVIIHHLAVDGVSWRILMEDIDTLLRQTKEQQLLILPPKTSSFRTWSNKLSEYANSNILKEKAENLRSILDNEFPILPKDYNDKNRYIEDIVSLSFSLSEKDTKLLKTEVNKAFNTNIQDLLLIALGLAVKETFKVFRLKVDIEGHGRKNIFPEVDVSRTVGWFTIIYPVLLKFDVDHLDQLIKINKESIRAVSKNGIEYGIHKYLSNKTDYIIGKEESDILFNYLGQFDSDVSDKYFKLGDITGESVSKKRKRPYGIDISSAISGNKLHLRVSFGKKEYRNETMERLISSYEKSLKSLIQHCTNIEQRKFTPSDFTYKELSIDQLDHIQSNYSVKDIYTLSPMQEGMLFHSLLDPDHTAYFVQFSYRLHGKIDVKVLDEAFKRLIHRYDVLRTVFIHEDLDRPLQLVLEDKTEGVYYSDIRSEIEQSTRENIVEKYRHLDKSRNFQLSKDTLIRLNVLLTDNDEFEFIWSYHHVLMDGWCTSILVKEFMDLYEGIKENKPPLLSPNVPYVKYIEWLEQKDKEKAKQYWSQYLQGYEGTTVFPVAGNSESPISELVEEILILEIDTVNDIKKLSIENGVTINTVIQTIWGILLSKYNNSNDVTFGAVVSGRPSEIVGIERMIGLFINTIPVRISIDDGETVVQLLGKVQEKALQSIEFDYYPLSNIQSEAVNGRQLISHILAFENFPVLEQIEGVWSQQENGNNESSDYRAVDVKVSEQTNYDLNIVVVPGDQFKIKFWYNSNTYAAATIESIISHFKQLIQLVISNPEEQITKLSMLSLEESEKLIFGFNDTFKPYDQKALIHELFEGQVKKTPNATALLFEGEVVTYNELNNRANCLARQLINDDENKGGLIAILMDRSVEMVISLFAILKSGGTYVPIEPYLPNARVSKLLNSLGCGKLIIDKNQLQRIQEFKEEIPSLKDIYCFDFNEEDDVIGGIHFENDLFSEENLNVDIDSEDIAYIIFTSGSSGTPKGVIIRHKSVINLIEWINEKWNINSRDRVLFVSSISFDLSVYDIFGILAGGGSVQIISHQDINNPQKLLSYIYKYGISYWDSAPAALQQLTPWFDSNQYKGMTNAFRLIFLSGDWIPLSLPNSMKEEFKKVEVIALGGATEATVWSNFFPVLEIDPNWKSIPYGKPIQNAKYYVLDKDLNPCPVGVPGDLYIGGDCIACGYVNEVILSSERFIENPYCSEENIYSTGDMARWYQDGNIEFLGRKDSQVKIRGYRIELGEIQYHLSKVEAIKEPRVLVKENKTGDKFLCAYYTANEEIDIRQLKDYLLNELPAYMIPHHIIKVDDFPVTSNGKLNADALPNPYDTTVSKKVISRNKLERQLVSIWAGVFKIEEHEIGIYDNFFDLGGHSLRAAVLVSKINKELGMAIPLKSIFSGPTVAELAVICEQSVIKKALIPKRSEKKEFYKTTSAQKQIFLAHKFYPKSTAYNIPNLVEVSVDLSIERLNEIFNIIVNRHEALRTSFKLHKGQLVQFIQDELTIKVEHLGKVESTDRKVFDDQLKLKVDQFIQPFDLKAAPLLRVGFIEGIRNILIVDIHHIVSDGASQEVLSNDFLRLLRGEELLKQELQFKDIPEFRDTVGYRKYYKTLESYWITKLQGELPEVNLGSQPRPEIKSFKGANKRFQIDESDVQWLRSYAKQEKTSLNALLLSIFNAMIGMVSGQDHVIMGFSMTGRNHEEMGNIVGALLNNIVLQTFPLPERKFNDFFNSVIADFLEVLEHQEYSFEDLVERLNIPRRAGRNPLFEIIYSFEESELVLEDENILNAGYLVQNPTAKFDLFLQITAAQGKLHCNFVYAEDILDKEAVDNYVIIFKHIIHEIKKDKNVLLKDILNTYKNSNVELS